MKGWGIALIVIGVVIALASLFMETSVPTEMQAASIYGLPRTSDVYNLGKLQAQLLVFIAGLAVAIAGVTIAAAGAVLAGITRAAVPPYPVLPTQPDVTSAIDNHAGVQNHTDGPAWLSNEDAEFRRLTLAGIGIVLIALVTFVLFMSEQSSPGPTAAQIQQNADMIADSIERNAALIDDLAPHSHGSK